jgi:Sigma-70 region 2
MDPGLDEEFANFVDGRFTALQRFGYLLTGEWHLAEDLVQTSLTKVWFHRKSLRHVAALEGYTRTVMVNTSTQWWRRKWKGETPTEFLPEASAPSQYGWWKSGTGCSAPSRPCPAGPAPRSCCGTSRICRTPRSPRSWVVPPAP